MKKININKEQEYILLNYLKEELKYFENEEDNKKVINNLRKKYIFGGK